MPPVVGASAFQLAADGVCKTSIGGLRSRNSFCRSRGEPGGEVADRRRVRSSAQRKPALSEVLVERKCPLQLTPAHDLETRAVHQTQLPSAGSQ